MTELIYNLGIRLYFLFASVLGLTQKKAKLFVLGRKGLLEQIRKDVKTDSPVIWIHCSSVGEFEQARPIIEKYKESASSYKILLTFFSPSGYELRKNYPYADWVFYLPMDTRKNAREFLNIVKPVKVIFIKYEFWYNYLSEIRRRDIPLFIISVIFTEKQIFFRWYGAFFRRMLMSFTKLFVQDVKSKELLAGIGLTDNVEVVGDTRFDRVIELLNSSNDVDTVKEFASSSITMIVGSSWEKDEENIVEILDDIPYCKIVIAPHEVECKQIERLELSLSKYGVVKYSELEKQRSRRDEGHFAGFRVMIVDCIGILSTIYKYGDIAYVGGGFGSGIHNILEPAVYGLPVIIGPNYSKYKEAKDLIALGGVRSYCSIEELKQYLTLWLSDEESRRIASSIAEEYVKNNTGATPRILSQI